MSDSADHTVEAEPLKGRQEEKGGPDGRGCAGKMGVAKLSGWRTAAFLLSMFICLSVVFAFSFILPCPVRPQYLPTWNLTVPAAVTYNFLAFADANNDKVLDVFLIYKSSEGLKNHTCIGEGLFSPCLFLLAVDGTDGELLWERPLAAEFDWAECEVGGVKGKGGNCVVAHADKLTAIDIHAALGEILWQVPRSQVANGNLPVISLPDLNNDKTNDMAVLSYPTTDTPSVAELVFFSGKSGDKIGTEVDVGVAPGQMKSHLQFSTASEAQYVLLHTDRGLYAVSLGRLAANAGSGLDSNLKRDKSWEQRADNQGLITLYDSVSLHSVLKVRGGYSSSSPSLLLQTDSTVMLFDTHKLSVTWTTNASSLISTPSFGHFNKDGVPDIVLEEDQGNNTKRVVIVDGQNGNVLWQVFMPFRLNNPQPASVLTLNYFSVFMLWGETHTHTNDTSLEVEERSSYLLHPFHSDVLLERRNPAQNIITFKALLLERGRHACYLILTGEDGALNEGAALDGTEPVVLTKRKIKGDVSQSSVVGVGGAGRLDGDASGQAETVKEAFYRLRFSDQSQ
ncbi:protein FAM234A [Pangasianodon hypophthalmus]|uniref:protein FAM234A n=1 Tax=Pangasianodon hypophthalmus TaxID=310915 RepID=UPI002307F284|nr:protein FAM234A [Pangasianodon hypophthalmus]